MDLSPEHGAYVDRLPVHRITKPNKHDKNTSRLFEERLHASPINVSRPTYQRMVHSQILFIVVEYPTNSNREQDGYMEDFAAICDFRKNRSAFAVCEIYRDLEMPQFTDSWTE